MTESEDGSSGVLISMVPACSDRFMNEQYLSDRPLALGGEMSLRAGRYYAVIDEAMFKACRDKGRSRLLRQPEGMVRGRHGLHEGKA